MRILAMRDTFMESSINAIINGSVYCLRGIFNIQFHISNTLGCSFLNNENWKSGIAAKKKIYAKEVTKRKPQNSLKLFVRWQFLNKIVDKTAFERVDTRYYAFKFRAFANKVKDTFVILWNRIAFEIAMKLFNRYRRCILHQHFLFCKENKIS